MPIIKSGAGKSEDGQATRFKRAQGAQGRAKPDPPGKVAVRIISVDERSADLTHKSGNRREDIVLEGTTVGEVYEHLLKALGLE
jgi:hypothetical protein